VEDDSGIKQKNQLKILQVHCAEETEGGRGERRAGGRGRRGQGEGKEGGEWGGEVGSNVFSSSPQTQIPRGLTARIAGFHPAGPGSTPGVGTLLIFNFIYARYFCAITVRSGLFWHTRFVSIRWIHIIIQPFFYIERCRSQRPYCDEKIAERAIFNL
jgi:hypothetical protein